MRVTRPMLEAAIRADYDYLQRTGRMDAGRHIPNEEYLRAIAQSVLDYLQPSDTPTPPGIRRTVVTAKRPSRRA